MLLILRVFCFALVGFYLAQLKLQLWNCSFYYSINGNIFFKDTPPESPVIYRLGDLVWSYVPGHPLWPCMLVNDPLESKCTKMQGMVFELY